MKKLEFCEHYIIRKLTRVQFGIAVHQIEAIMDYVSIRTLGANRDKHQREVQIDLYRSWMITDKEFISVPIVYKHKFWIYF